MSTLEDKGRAEFEAAYPAIVWTDTPTEMNTRQMAFSRGFKAAKESSRAELEAAKQRILSAKEESATYRMKCRTQELHIEALEKKLAEQHSIMKTMLDIVAAAGAPTIANKMMDLNEKCGAKELTKLLTAARQQGFEEGGALSDEFINSQYLRGKQAGRDELLTEYSALCAVGYVDRRTGYVKHSPTSDCDALIFRPLPPQTKG